MVDGVRVPADWIPTYSGQDDTPPPPPRDPPFPLHKAVTGL